MDREMTSADGVVELLASGLAEVDIDIADIPFAGDFVGQSAGQLEAQLCFPVDGKGICQIGGVTGVVIEIAVVAHEVADAGSLAVEVGDAEGRSALDEPFGAGGVDERLHGCGEVDVADGVEGVEGVELDGVAYLAFLGILLRYGFVGDVAAEETVVLQDGACYGGAECGIDLAHQHRGLAKRLHHPFGKARLLAGVLIVDPEVPGPGNGVVAASEEGAVGLCGEGCLQFFLRRGQMFAIGLILQLRFTGVGNLCEAREELVVFRDALRHRTGHEQGCCQDGIEDVTCFHCGLFMRESVWMVSRKAGFCGCMGRSMRGWSFFQKRKMSQKLSSLRRQMKPPPYSLV